ncbi:DUF1345 domain-containing protein [Sphingomonas sp. RB1R13]|uniref:DUF1345 domain-containing protein n=1 Tax=Sphingomonas sp. RB1R13 TaxID=3096159 RepID=UPI002FC7C32E
MTKRASGGNRLIPPLFRWFFAALVIGWAAGFALLGWERALLAGFDFAALVFFARTSVAFSRTTKELRKIANENDANRTQLLVLSFILTLVILTAMVSMMSGPDKIAMVDKVFIAASLVTVWVFGNLVYTLHYAHLYYSTDDGGKDCAGLDFPGDHAEPDFADFVYFAFTLGVAVQTSDVQVTSPHFRKVVTAHCVAGFFFNLGVLALTINVLASN